MLPLNQRTALPLAAWPHPPRAGLFAKSYPGYPWVYASDRYHDKMMLGAAWLYRATGGRAAGLSW